MKKTLILIISCLVIFVGAITFGIVYSRPKIVAANSITGAVEDLLSREAFSVMTDVVNGGSIEFAVNEITEDDYVVFGRKNEELSGKLYMNAKKNKFYLKDFVLSVDDELDIDADIYLSDKMLYVSESETLDLEVGVEFKKLAKELEKSIFSYDSDSDYSLSEVMSEEDYDNLIEALESTDSLKAVKKDVKKLIKHLATEVGAVVLKNVEVSCDSQSMLLNGHRKTVRVITITATREDLENIIDEVCATVLADDKKIEKFINEYEGIFSIIFGYDEDEYSSAYSYYSEMIEKLRLKLAEKFSDMEQVDSETKLVASIVTPTLSTKLLKFSVGYETNSMYDGDIDEGVYVSRDLFVLDAGTKGLKKTDEISLTVGSEQLRYIVRTDNRKEFVSNLYLNGEKLVSLYHNKDKGKFSASLHIVEADDEMIYTLEGNIKKKLGKYDIKLNSLVKENTYGKVISEYNLDIKITISKNDRVPSAPKNYDTLSDIRNKDMDKWLDAFDFLSILI